MRGMTLILTKIPPKNRNNNMDDSKYTKTKQKIITFFVGLGIVFVALFIIFYFVIGISRVDGESMMPSLKNNQTLVFYRLQRNFKRGDIIAVDMPNGDYYVKRVIGVAGDVVDIKDGKVFLNGKELNEPYKQGQTNPEGVIVKYPLTVSEGKVFVLGDNREHSTDSRAIGEVSLYAIPGIILGK